MFAHACVRAVEAGARKLSTKAAGLRVREDTVAYTVACKAAGA